MISSDVDTTCDRNKQEVEDALNQRESSPPGGLDLSIRYVKTYSANLENEIWISMEFYLVNKGNQLHSISHQESQMQYFKMCIKVYGNTVVVRSKTELFKTFMILHSRKFVT